MISVIIPTYNRAATLERSIDSVLCQTYNDFELIIVDDGSTDNTEEIIKNYSDKRIRYYKKENGGAASARNYGILKAQGQYIAFQDSDDVWKKNKLSVQLKAIIENDADIVVCRFERHNYKIKKGLTSFLPRIESGFVSFETAVKECVVSTQTVFCKNEVLKNIKFDETLRKLEDYEWSIRASEKYKLFLCDDILVDVYLQNDSITHNGSDLGYIEEIFKRNEELLRISPIAYAYMLNYVGINREMNNIKGYTYFYKAFTLTKNVKYLLKSILSVVGVLRIMEKRS